MKVHQLITPNILVGKRNVVEFKKHTPYPHPSPLDPFVIKCLPLRDSVGKLDIIG